MSTDSDRKSADAGRLTPGAAAGLGLDLAVGMAVFAFGGYWLDRRRGTGQFWTLCGVFLGLVYAAYEVWKSIRALDPGKGGKGRPR